MRSFSLLVLALPKGRILEEVMPLVRHAGIEPEAAFDDRVTTGGIRSIMNMVTAAVPALDDATLNWAVSGLRPGSPDEMPLLGTVSGMDRLILASGHYTSGILLCPITGLLIANLITGGDTELLDAFSPDRFRDS